MGSLISSFDACRLMTAQPKDLICLFRSNSGVSGHRHRCIISMPRCSALGYNRKHELANVEVDKLHLLSLPD